MVSCLQGKEKLGTQEAAGKQMLRGGWVGSEARSSGAPGYLRAAGAKASRINKTENRG